MHVHELCVCVIHMSACIILCLHLCCCISKMKPSLLAIRGAEACASDVRAAGASSGTECRSELSLFFFILDFWYSKVGKFNREDENPHIRTAAPTCRDSYPAPWPHQFARSEAVRTEHFDRAYSRFELMSTWLVGGYLKWLIL